MLCRHTGFWTGRVIIDLFTAWERRGDFAIAADAVVETYRAGGYNVEVSQRFETFARLAVTHPPIPDRLYKGRTCRKLTDVRCRP